MTRLLHETRSAATPLRVATDRERSAMNGGVGEDAGGTRCATTEGGRLLTKREVAAMARVSVRCVNEQMRRGWLPYVKLSRQLVRFRLGDVERWIEEAARRNANRGLRTDAGGRRTEGGGRCVGEPVRRWDGRLSAEPKQKAESRKLKCQMPEVGGRPSEIADASHGLKMPEDGRQKTEI